MAGLLTKQKGTTFIASKAGLPGKPAVFPRAGYYSMSSMTVCGPIYKVSGYKTAFAVGGDIAAVPVYSAGGYSCSQQTITVYNPPVAAVPAVPPVPPTPEQSIANMNLGWTGGANSVQRLEDSGAFTFQFVKGVAAVVGLTRENASTDFAEATHGLYIQTSRVTVVERGSYLLSFARQPSDTYRIARRDGVVSYLINGATVYQSLVPSLGPVVLDASLYSGGDEVLLLSSGGEGGGGGLMEPLASAGGARFNQGAGFLKSLTSKGSGTERLHAASYLLPLRALGGRLGAASGETYLQPLKSHGQTGAPEPEYAIGEAYLHPFGGFGLVLSGEIGAGASFFRPLGSKGGRPVADGAAVMAPLEAYGNNYSGPQEAFLFDGVAAWPQLQAARLMSAAFSDSMAVLGVVSTQTVANAAMFESLSAITTAAASSIVMASLVESVRLAGGNAGSLFTPAGKPADPAKCWVINYDTGATTMYDGFDFTRLFEHQGRYYGERDGKAYLLDGDTDDGAQIDAFVAFGKRNFGTSAKKHIPYLYAGMASNGELILRATTPQGTYLYRAKRVSSELQAQRFDLGRGLNATFYEFEMFNEAGADFSLNSIEFTPIVTSRRI